jgi:hypothetical protein
MVSPTLNMQFFDENTQVPLNSLTVSLNDVEYSLDNEGKVSIGLASLGTATYEVSVWEDGNYSTRYFSFDINSTAQIDVNLFMLRTTQGNNIDFQFYDTDFTTLIPGARVTATLEDQNIASIRVLNGLAETTFFLNTDGNYMFTIEKTDGSVEIYYKTLVKSEIPKDEDTLAAITPFNAYISTIGANNLVNYSNAVPISLFNNTKDYYSVDINAAGYFERKIQLLMPGNPEAYSLQAYLAAIPTSTSTKVITQSIIDYDPIAAVKVDIYKFLPGEGRVLMESVITDSKGEAFISGITNDQYEFEVYYDGVLIQDFDVTVTSTTILIRFNETDLGGYEDVPIARVAFTPSNVQLISETTLTQAVSVENGTITRIRVYATEINDGNHALDNNLYNAEYAVGVTNGYTNNIDIATQLAAWDANYSITLTVDVELSDGKWMRFKTTYRQFVTGRVGIQTLDILKNEMAGIVGCKEGEECGLLLAMAVFITAIGCAGFTIISPFKNISGILLVALMIMGFFTFMTWVSPFLYFLMVILCMMAFIVYRRVE